MSFLVVCPDCKRVLILFCGVAGKRRYPLDIRHKVVETGKTREEFEKWQKRVSR